MDGRRPISRQALLRKRFNYRNGSEEEDDVMQNARARRQCVLRPGTSVDNEEQSDMDALPLEDMDKGGYPSPDKERNSFLQMQRDLLELQLQRKQQESRRQSQLQPYQPGPLREPHPRIHEHPEMELNSEQQNMHQLNVAERLLERSAGPRSWRRQLHVTVPAVASLRTRIPRSSSNRIQGSTKPRGFRDLVLDVKGPGFRGGSEGPRPLQHVKLGPLRRSCSAADAASAASIPIDSHESDKILERDLGLAVSLGVGDPDDRYASLQLQTPSGGEQCLVQTVDTDSVGVVMENGDLLKMVLMQLQVVELCRVSSVSRLWMQVVHDSSFWRRVNLLGRTVWPKQLVQLCRRHRHDVEELRAGGSMVLETDSAALCSIASELTRLSVLELRTWQLTDMAMSRLNAGLPSLRELILQDVRFRTNAAANGEVDAMLSHLGLTSLHLSGIKAHRFELICPQLRRLFMHSCMFSYLSASGRNLPLLERLHISEAQRLSDLTILSTVSSLTSLRHLSFEDMSVPEELLRSVARSLEHLSQLELKGCLGLGLSLQRGSPGFGALKRLVVRRTDMMTQATLEILLGGCSALEELVVEGCSGVFTLAAVLPALRSASVKGCRGLSLVDFKCRRLEELHLGALDCGRPVGSQLRRVELSSDALRSVCWSHLPLLEDLVLHCPSLTSLSLRDCDSLTDRIFDVLTDVEEVMVAADPAEEPQSDQENEGGAAVGGGPGAEAEGARDGRPAALLEGMEPEMVQNQNTAASRQIDGLRSLVCERDLDREEESAAPLPQQSGARQGPAIPAGDTVVDQAVAAEAAPRASDPTACSSTGPSALGGCAATGTAAADASSAAVMQEAAPWNTCGGWLRGILGKVSCGGFEPKQPELHLAQAPQPPQQPNQVGPGTAGGDSCGFQQAASFLEEQLALRSEFPHTAGLQLPQPLPPHQKQHQHQHQHQQQLELPLLLPPLHHERPDPQTQRLQPQREGASAQMPLGPLPLGQAVATEVTLPPLHQDRAQQGALGPHRRPPMTASQDPGMGERHPYLPRLQRPSLQQPPQPRQQQQQQPGPHAQSELQPLLWSQEPKSRHPRQVVTHSKVGGCPSLRELRLEGCDGLHHVRLRHGRLGVASFHSCRGLRTLQLSCSSLESLVLQECGDLEALSLSPAAMRSLSLGAFSTLRDVELVCSSLEQLSFRGCGGLTRVVLNCPQLRDLDASFCNGLTDEGLAMGLINRPPLASLLLSVCCSLGPGMTAALSSLTGLRELDLSYCSVSQLAPVLSCCTGLTSLCLGSCPELIAGGEELLRLIPHRDPALPNLVSLDVSYCPLSPHVAKSLVRGLSRLTSLALNGCAGVDEGVWRGVMLREDRKRLLEVSKTGAPDPSPAEARAAWDVTKGMAGQANGCVEGPGSQLEKLSLVRCTALVSLCLGLMSEKDGKMLPDAARSGSAWNIKNAGADGLPGFGASSGHDVARCGSYAKEYIAPVPHGRVSVSGPGCGWLWPEGGPPPRSLLGPPWRPVGCLLSGLRSLRLGLSGVQTVALALPHLTHLDLNGCRVIRSLELRCPALRELHLQACCSLPADLWLPLLETLDLTASREGQGLKLLDVQHAGAFGEAVAAAVTAAAVAAADEDTDSDPGPGCSSACGSAAAVIGRETKNVAEVPVATNSNCSVAGGGKEAPCPKTTGTEGIRSGSSGAGACGGGAARGIAVRAEMLLAARDQPWWLLPRGATILVCGPNCATCATWSHTRALGLSG